MNAPMPTLRTLVAALIGLASLASAMGVGRFAFTPLLPLMQANGSVDLAQGGTLAVANYVGYFVGALLCGALAPAPHRAARLGLVAVAVLTLAMGVTHGMTVWIALRFGAGVASACVLVGVSAWALAVLAERGRPDRAGWVYSGVGVGIAAAGIVGLVAALWKLDPAQAWLALGAASAVIAIVSWPSLRPVVVTVPSGAAEGARAIPWRLVLAYFSFGFGYIIPATFLPAMARARIDDPAVFGGVWPAFGIAAALSTALAALRFRRIAPRKSWRRAQSVMAAGVLVPALWQSPWALLVSATCVGGTFMIITMAGMQEARRVSGASASRLMALMTAAFALGQIAGPITMAVRASGQNGGAGIPSILATLVLLAGIWALRESDEVAERATRNVERNSA